MSFRPSRRNVWRAVQNVLGADGGQNAAIQTFATQIILVAINMATGVITARLLGPDGRGLFAAATLWPQALSSVFSLGLPAALTYHLRADSEARGAIFTVSLVLGAILSGVAVPLGIFIVPYAMNGYSRDDVFLAQMCAPLTAQLILMVIFRQIAISWYMIFEYNISLLFPPLLYLISIVFIHSFESLTVENTIICLYIPQIIAAIWIYLRIQRKIPATTSSFSRILRSIVTYSMRGSVTDLLSGISGYIDRIILVFILTPSSLGVYVVAYSLSRLILIIQTLVNSVFFPTIVGKSLDEIVALHAQTIRLVAFVTLAAVAGAALLGGPVLTLFYGRQFSSAQPIFVILSAEAALTCIGQVTLQAFNALNRPGFTSIAQSVSFSVALSGMLLLAPAYGGVGAAVSLAGAAAVRLGVLLMGFIRLPGASRSRLYPAWSDFQDLMARLRA